MWSHIQQDIGVLPAKFGRIVRYDGWSPLDTSLRLELRVKDSNATGLIFDAVFVDENHRLRLLLEDIAMTGSPSLKRLASQSL
jgi:hypothetical protein